jgi:hypothetical protein
MVDPLSPSLIKTALYEAIAAAEMCGTGFELIIGERKDILK